MIYGYVDDHQKLVMCMFYCLLERKNQLIEFIAKFIKVKKKSLSQFLENSSVEKGVAVTWIGQKSWKWPLDDGGLGNAGVRQ